MIMISAAKDSLFEIFAINITLVLVSELNMRERKPVNLAIISMADNECYKVRESSQIIIEDSALFSFERCREGLFGLCSDASFRRSLSLSAQEEQLPLVQPGVIEHMGTNYFYRRSNSL